MPGYHQEEGIMNSLFRCSKLLTLAAVLGVVSIVGCAPQPAASEAEVMATSTSSMQEGSLVHDGQELFGHYNQPEPFPQPLPNDAHSHEGWTWGSMAAVFAESTDRIWIAMRGELPLPDGADPWTPYALLNPSRGNAPPTDDNGNHRSPRRRAAACVPHPVLWTQVNATPPGVARAPRGPRSACDTRASRAARSCCTAPRTRSLRRVPP